MKTTRQFVVCALALLLAGALPANATVPYTLPKDAPAAVSLIDHLHTELRSKDALRRQNALADVMSLAACSASCTISFRSLPGKTLQIENEMGVGTVIDLTALLPDLKRIYYTDRSDQDRLQALDALLTIGNEQSLEQLITTPARSSAHVREMTQRGVARYFMDKYPTLKKRAYQQRGTLSLDDVERARQQHKRMMRRTAQRG